MKRSKEFFNRLINKFLDEFSLDEISSEELIKQYYRFQPFELYVAGNIFESSSMMIEDDNFTQSDTVYPSNQVRELLIDKFKLKDWQLSEKNYNNITTYLYAKELYAVIPDIDHNLRLFDKEMLNYGYFRATQYEYSQRVDGQKWILILYNPIKKFDCNEYVRNGILLYHLTPIKKLEQIKTQGLVPQSCQLYNNEPRTFFICGNWQNKQLIEIMKAKCKPYNNYMCAVIPIDAQELPEHIKFYVDPNQEYCVYTNFIIRPQLIDFENVQSFDISKLKIFRSNEPIGFD